MTIAPFAEQRLTPVNYTEGGVTRPPRGMVLHIAQGGYEGTIGWARNPSAKVSYYFVVAKDGRIAQVVDLDDRAWTQGTGNREWIGVEHEGFVPDKLTPAQLAADAKILAWLHTKYGVPLQITDSPLSGHGLGWHGMGQHVGWGHPECPGPAIVAQRPQIIAQALALVNEGTVVAQFTPPIPAESQCVFQDKESGTCGAIVRADGAVYATAGFRGGANGQAYFKGRKAARIIAHKPYGYTIIATSGERYNYP